MYEFWAFILPISVAFVFLTIAVKRMVKKDKVERTARQAAQDLLKQQFRTKLEELDCAQFELSIPSYSTNHGLAYLRLPWPGGGEVRAGVELSKESDQVVVSWTRQDGYAFTNLNADQMLEMIRAGANHNQSA